MGSAVLLVGTHLGSMLIRPDLTGSDTLEGGYPHCCVKLGGRCLTLKDTSGFVKAKECDIVRDAEPWYN